MIKKERERTMLKSLMLICVSWVLSLAQMLFDINELLVFGSIGVFQAPTFLSFIKDKPVFDWKKKIKKNVENTAFLGTAFVPENFIKKIYL